MRKLLLTPLAFVAAGALIGGAVQLFLPANPLAFLLGLALGIG